MTWDDYFLQLCDAVAVKSRDLSTKVGAVVVRPNQSVASTGWNGFPRGVNDTADRYANRETKYRFVCHAEANAITSAREPLEGCTLYASLFPCNECAKLIIQAGIKEVFSPFPSREHLERWGESFSASQVMFMESGVKVRFPETQPINNDHEDDAA